MSPRKPDILPEEVIATLRAALARCDADEEAAIHVAKEARKAAVQAALRYGSVRQVAAAAGLSPTTVHAWSKGQDR